MEETQRDGRITWDGTSVAAWNTQRVEQAKRDGTCKGWNKQGMEQARDGTSKGWDNQMMEQAQRMEQAPAE